MNEQSKGMKMLYTIFLISVTVHTVVLLMDRLVPKEPKCNCKKEKTDNG